MQDINSDERYLQFTQAIIDAAERRAEALITGAEREKAEMLRAAVNNGSQTEYVRLSNLAENTRSQMKANAAQDMRRELLQYRESLVKRLSDKVRLQCKQFAAGGEYKGFMQSKLNKYADYLQKGTAVAYVSAQDEALVKELCKTYKGVNVIADSEITLGGIRLAVANKIYDETLDAALAREEQQFLSYCGLRVV